MTTVSIHMPEQSGKTGLTLYLRKTSDGTLVNTGGDAFTESPASSGRFTATVAESWTETLSAYVINANSLAVRDGWLAVGATIVVDAYPSESSGGTGTGARTVTITVNDGTTALQNARVRLTEGANTFTGLTNASGVITFNVDDAAYTVSITKSGNSYAGTTLVVDGDKAVTYSMTANSSTPPDDPALCAVTLHLRNQYGVDLAGEPVEITWVQWDTGANETPPVLSVPPVQTTDSGGLVQVNLYREATYKIIYGNSPYTRRLDVTIPDAGTYEVEL